MIFSVKPRHRFVYKWLDNVQINMSADFNPNTCIPCGSSGMSIFANWTDAQLNKEKAVSHASG